MRSIDHPVNRLPSVGNTVGTALPFRTAVSMGALLLSACVVREQVSPQAAGKPSTSRLVEPPPIVPSPESLVPPPSTPAPAPEAPQRLLYWTDETYATHVDATALGSLADDERAAVLYVSTIVGNSCELLPTDDAAGHARYTCQLTAALGFQQQCGNAHEAYLRRWFAEDVPAGCVMIPITATVQSALERLTLTSSQQRLTVQYSGLGTTGPSGESWSWSETLHFERAAEPPLRLVERTRTGDPPGPREVPVENNPQ